MVTDIFAVIADRTRRDILDTLRTGDKAVGELVEALSASQPTVSKHLKVLRDAGLVTTRAQGQKRFYALRVEPLGEVGGWIAALRTTPGSPAAAAVPPGAVAESEETTVSGEEAALVPAAVVHRPGESQIHESHTHEPHTHEGGTEASRPAQIQRSVERTVERAAARATELMANLPKFGRRK
ncbi:ArsR/SmtB family transcription factor [Sinomonas sp. P10A9]|uniref:ArsR/SmtB family transcription factor n=1 Tax=Sinomonas puerhi TaxID=3238584 RepID=A0AB39L204_9MICC